MATKESRCGAKNPGLAALLSCLYMGLGHIYTGEIRKGISLILLYTGSLALIPLLVGLVTTPMLWLRGMAYAYKSAENFNRQLAEGLAAVGHLGREAEPQPEMVLDEPFVE